MVEEIEEINKNATLERDWTRGNVFLNLLSLAWPMILNETLWGIGPIVDMIWIGRLGSASIAGVGVAGIIFMVLMSAFFGLCTGMMAMVSRFIGARDVDGARHAALQAFVMTGVFSLIMALLGILFAEPVLVLFGVNPDVVHEGAAYLRIQLAGTLIMSFWVTGEMIMYACGDGKTPMKISVFARLTHVVFVPFLVLGLWIFPQLGVIGAALANLFGCLVGAVLALRALLSGGTRLKLTVGNFRVDPGMIRRMVRIGIPASVSGIQRSVGSLILMGLIVPFGTVPVAGHTLCQRIEGILFMPGIGLGMAAGTLVGQNLGACQPDRAEKSGWMAAGVVTAIMVTGSLAILLEAENISRLFTSEPDLMRTTSAFLRIATAGYLVMGFTSVLMQSLSSAGDTLRPMIINVAGTWAVQLPLAWLMSRYTALDVMGVRWAIVVSLFVGAAAYIVVFRLGRWKDKIV